LGVREGLGPGGIAVSVVEVQNQKTAYITLDGNNMVKGLREQVREAVMSIVEEAEVLATDTHVVNGVSLTERGYHPVGEVGSLEGLVSSIRECTVEAVSHLAESRQSSRRIRVPGLLVIGEEKLRELSMLVDSSVTLFKRLVFLIYVPTILLAGLVFLLIP
jgi:putative membrane protein